MAPPFEISEDRFDLPVPFGWFAVARSAELKAGEIMTIELCGQEFVIWRGDDGASHGLSATCPHLGAHLGHGGIVVGNDIRCPFHHWSFGGDGGVVNVPYQEEVPRNLAKPCRERSLPIHEDLGIVFAWWHPHQADPLFEVKPVEEISEQGWISARFEEWLLDVHIQEITENSADIAHFPALHGIASPPLPEMRVDGFLRYTSATTKLPTRRGEVEGKIDVRAIGPGISFTRFWGIAEMLLLQLQTPLDGGRTHLRHLYFHPEELEASKVNVTRKLIDNTVSQLEEDAKIWPYKRHLKRPLLVKNDGPIMQYRRFYSRFYADEEGRDETS